MNEAVSTPQEVLNLLREMTGQSTVMSAAIASSAGLSPPDLEVLGAIEQHGPLTAGRLSELTGLPINPNGQLGRHSGPAPREPDRHRDPRRGAGRGLPVVVGQPRPHGASKLVRPL